MKTQHRQTKQRTALLDLLRSTKSHPTAAWLYERLRANYPAMSQGTVYRNLSVLAKQGQVLVLRSGSTFDRFDADTSQHYHIVCERCGRVDDLPLGAEASRDTEAERVSGYRVTGHRIDYFGVCPDCLTASGADGS